MESFSLFLGYGVDDEFKKKLSLLPDSVRRLYIADQSADYLVSLQWDSRELVGKYLGNQIDSDALKLVSAHVISLLKCLAPDGIFRQECLQLFVVPNRLY